MTESPDFLLVRAADLLQLGVRWSDLELVRGAGPRGSPPRLVAHDDTARVVLTFPPQAIAEAKFTALGEVGRRAARLAGSSRLAFTVAAGTEIELSPEGLLAVLGNEAQKLVSTGDGMPTAIELPWHLIVSAQASSGEGVVSDHMALPLASELGVVGLWHARLRARDGTAIEAGLALLVLEANQDDALLDVAPLNGGQRQSIKTEADQGRLARARRLELSTLGGSLSARLETEAIDWDHDATLGRDQRVRVLQRGVLYPFGHRAEYTEIAERIFDPAGSPTVAGMHRQELLRVTEPMRVLTDGSTELVRSFPFSEVEILTRSFADLKTAEFKRHKRPRLTDQDLIDEIAALRVELDPPNGLLQGFSDAFALEPQSRDAYVLSELGSAPALREARLKRDITDPDGMQQRRNELLAEKAFLLSRIPVDPPPPPDEIIVEGEPPPPPPPEADDDFIDEILAAVAEIDRLLATEVSEAAIAQARIDAPILAQRAADLEVVVTAEFESRDTLDEFIASQAPFNPDAQRVLDLNQAIAGIQTRIQAIAAAAEVENPVYWTPQTKDGATLQFPVRCRAANGDVFFSVPLVFIKDLKIDPSDHFEAFDALTDPEIARLVKEEWDAATASGTIPLPGVSIDMVGDSPERARPGDVHEVHALTLEAVPHDGGFRPKLTQFEVELPAIRTLLPEDLPGGRPVLKFTESFLRQEVIPPIPFELPELDGAPQIAVDFTEAANRSGGLVSPKFAANLISRELGPVASDALPPELAEGLPAGLPEFNLETAYKGATLLGFPLAALIKLPEDALPPAIVQLFKGGVPDGMRMNWTLDLDEHGPFRPGPETKLDLTVECTLAKRETTCKVNDFKLVLPPGGSGDGLLTLEFEALRFTQREGQAPDLEIVGLQVGFGGALKLFQELQQELEKVIDLPDNRPTVDVKPTGLTAGYGISVPSVPTGAFLIRNIAMHVGVDVPFDGKPVSVSLSFATRHDPFNVSVLMFGGGGYIDLTLGPEGLTRLEASIDFGASLEIDFFIAKGEVHALAGVRFTQSGGTIAIDGFIRIGGSVEVLGLVSVSIELVVTLTYDDRDGNNRLVGRATLVIEIDLTLYADSVEIDSGEWVLAGSSDVGDRNRMGPPDGLLVAEESDPLDELRRYREAFAAR